jgi:ComF family protein
VRAWCVAERAGAVKILIDAFKFDCLRSAAKPLGEFISSTLPNLPDNLVITSVPTVSTHIRQRGYDHAALIAREVARQRGVKYQALLKRRTTTVQQGARRKERLKQAEGAFEAARHIDGSTVLIIDDIFTTGATLHYAAITLLAAGAREVWVAVVARQPLDDPVSL